MNLKDQIQKDYISAMKQKDRQRSDAIKMLRSAIKNLEIDKQKDASNEEVEGVLRQELKKRKEAVEQYGKAGRDDLVEKEQYEVELIEKYLPELMSKEEIATKVDEVLSRMQGGNFGQVMGMVMAELKGKADGKLVGEVVKEKLADA